MTAATTAPATLRETLRDAAADTTAPPAEAEVIDRGWAVWHNAMNTMWPASVREAVRAPAGELYDALDLYSCLLNDLIHPASVDGWDDLAHEDEAYAIGLERAAADVAEWTGELVRVFPACGTEAVLAGTEGGK